MKNSFGKNIIVTIFGESHGEKIGAVLDGIPSGIKIDTELIKKQLSLRKPMDLISTTRVEDDDFQIVSGVYNGYTCGSPICILISNNDTNSVDYSEIINKPRPSHSDYSAYCKYGSYGVLPGGGHFSGRVTAALVAAGAIAIQLLNNYGVKIGSHIKQIGDIIDRDFNNINDDIFTLNNKKFSVLDDFSAEKMIEKIKDVKSQNDSIGGVIETAIIGLKAGVGEPWFDTLEGVISHAVFSVPAVKGIEFGLGFNNANSLGSSVNDEFAYQNSEVKTITNNCGGILGGISNGQPIIFRTAFKPTPTISKPQKTVDLLNRENCLIVAKGRHDPCIVHRARVVVDSVTALAVLDLLVDSIGEDVMKDAVWNNR